MLNVQYRKYNTIPKSVDTEKLGKVYARDLLKVIKAVKKHLSLHVDKHGKQRIARLQFKSDRITVFADDEHQESVKLYLNYKTPADVDIILDSLHRSPTYPGLLDLATKEEVIEFEIDRVNHVLIVKEKGCVSRIKIFRLNEPMKQAIVPVSPVVTHKESTFRRLPSCKVSINDLKLGDDVMGYTVHAIKRSHPQDYYTVWLASKAKYAFLRYCEIREPEMIVYDYDISMSFKIKRENIEQVDERVIAIVPVSPVVTHKESSFRRADCTICQSPATIIFEGDAICAACNQRIKDYVQRVEDRVERMYNRAEKTEAAFHEANAKALKMASIIPMGQPILVGHHSEKRDRRYRERIDQTFRRGYALMKKSEYQKERAKSAENNRAISSDDPAAVIKLREKISKAEADHAEYKRYNKAIRKIRKQHFGDGSRVKALMAELGIKEKTAGNLLTPDYGGRYGIPSYMLTNNNANIRRMKKRLEELEKQNKRLATEDTIQTEEHDGVQLVRDLGDNRLRLVFDGKPSAEIRTLLKQRGFRWSPSNGAWQRKINNSAEYQAKFIMEQVATIEQK